MRKSKLKLYRGYVYDKKIARHINELNKKDKIVRHLHNTHEYNTLIINKLYLLINPLMV